MKKLFSVLFLLPGLLAFAQEEMNSDEDVRTLFKKGTPIGFFAEWNNRPALINNQAAFMTGGKLSLVFNHRINFGFGGYGLTTPVESDVLDANGNIQYYDMGYGGLIVEPVVFHKSLVHFTLPVLIGVGGAGYRSSLYGDYWDDSYWDSYHADAFFVVEPGINAELNIFKWMRLDAGISHRFVSSGYFGTPLGEELSGWSANVSLKFGKF